MLDDLEKINAILEGLHKNEKTAIYIEPPTFGVRVKHGQVVIIGEGWSEDEVKETLNAFGFLTEKADSGTGHAQNTRSKAQPHPYPSQP